MIVQRACIFIVEEASKHSRFQFPSVSAIKGHVNDIQEPANNDSVNKPAWRQGSS